MFDTRRAGERVQHGGTDEPRRWGDGKSKSNLKRLYESSRRRSARCGSSTVAPRRVRQGQLRGHGRTVPGVDQEGGRILPLEEELLDRAEEPGRLLGGAGREEDAQDARVVEAEE